VNDIEPESSMIASMLVAGTHALTCAPAAPPATFGTAMAATMIAAVADNAYLPRFMLGTSPIEICEPDRLQLSADWSSAFDDDRRRGLLRRYPNVNA
jgi:hypothetical protein